VNILEKSNTVTQGYEATRTYSALRVARVAMNLTQERLSELSGVSRRRIGQLEAGQGRPRRVTAVALAAVLQVEVDDLWPDLKTNRTQTRER
jgi:transcriptional regulator with XRE-family HTH domain